VAALGSSYDQTLRKKPVPDAGESQCDYDPLHERAGLRHPDRPGNSKAFKRHKSTAHLDDSELTFGRHSHRGYWDSVGGRYQFQTGKSEPFTYLKY
jgi:hypothetical protein